MDPVARLSGDVVELMDQENPRVVPDTRSAEEKFKQLHDLSEDVHRHLHTIMDLIKELTGDTRACQRHMPPAEAVELLEKLIAADLPVQLLAQLPNLEFEARMDVMNVCCAMFWPGMPHHFDHQVVEYLRDHPVVFELLVEGYTKHDCALHYGVVLRSCARHKELVRAFLNTGQVFELLKHTMYPSIDISSDAFYSLREMLQEQKDVSAQWLEQNFGKFFDQYNGLLKSGEYVAERQAQKLLTEMLLDRHFRKVMLMYVSDERNLQIHMNLLRDPSKIIQAEAFNVFRIFVANPNKPPRIQQILLKNREKLIQWLATLNPVKPDDKKFLEDKRNVIGKLQNLDRPSSPVAKPPSDVSSVSSTTSSLAGSTHHVQDKNYRQPTRPR